MSRHERVVIRVFERRKLVRPQELGVAAQLGTFRVTAHVERRPHAPTASAAHVVEVVGINPALVAALRRATR